MEKDATIDVFDTSTGNAVVVNSGADLDIGGGNLTKSTVTGAGDVTITGTVTNAKNINMTGKITMNAASVDGLATNQNLVFAGNATFTGSADIGSLTWTSGDLTINATAADAEVKLPASELTATGKIVVTDGKLTLRGALKLSSADNEVAATGVLNLAGMLLTGATDGTTAIDVKNGGQILGRGGSFFVDGTDPTGARAIEDFTTGAKKFDWHDTGVTQNTAPIGASTSGWDQNA